jgi:hypothetical protein
MAGDSPQANCPAPAGGRTPASIRQNRGAKVISRFSAKIGPEFAENRNMIMK